MIDPMTTIRRAAIAASLALAATTAGPARAHFLWVKYDEGRAKASAFLSETPQPDSADLLKVIEGAKLSAAGRPLGWTKGEDAFEAKLPEPRPAGGVDGECDLGVKERAGVAFRLIYTAAARVAPAAATAEGPSTHLRLALVERPGRGPAARVTFRGRPAEGAVVKAIPDGEGEGATAAELKSDADGYVEHPGLAAGKVGLLARWSAKEPGDLDGKPYAEVRYYATLTVAPPPAGDDKHASVDAADADAVLAGAYAARASWGPGFPGFTADVVVDLDGRSARGVLDVADDGTVALDLPAGPPKDWATTQLRSIVMHRGIDGPPHSAPGATFEGPDDGHPLGRLVRLPDDRMGSTYRIKDGQILEVNRKAGARRFSNRVLRNERNAEGKVLPSAYTVSYWDEATGRLDRTESFRDAWARVGTLDLPTSHLQVVTADDRSTVARVELSNHRLKPTSAEAAR